MPSRAELEARFAELAARRDAGSLSPEAFAAATAELRYEDDAGQWHQLDPGSGGWVIWSGGAWVPEPPAEQPTGDRFDRAAAAYRALVERRRQGQLDDESFRAEVAGLQVADEAGDVWQIQPETGAWMRWDGREWVAAEPPRRTADGRPAVAESVFAEVERAYERLESRRAVGELDEESFAAGLETLRLTDEQGVWWRRIPSGWVRWDGQAWTPAEPPRTEQAAVGPPRSLAGDVSASVKDEFKATLRSLPRLIATILITRVVIAAITGVFAILLHAYFAGVMNNGIRDDGGPWAPWLYLTGSQQGPFSWMAIWGTGGWLLSSLLITAVRRGPAGALKRIAAVPVMIWRRLTSAGRAGAGAVCLGAAIALLLSRFLQLNGAANLSLGIGFLFAGVGRPGYWLARFVMGVTRRVWARRRAAAGRAAPDLRLAQLAAVGVAPGFLLAARLGPAQAVVAAGVLGIVGVLLLLRRRPDGGLAAQILACAAVASLAGLVWLVLDWLAARLVFADDRGKAEYGGPPGTYWQNEGPALVKHSTPVAGATGAGAAGGSDLGDDDEEEDDEFSYSLTLDAYSLDLTGDGRSAVAARVDVSGGKAEEASRKERSLNKQIDFRLTGNVIEWFQLEVEDWSPGRRALFALTLPEQPGEGPHLAWLVASVKTPKGVLTARCRINLLINEDYRLILDPTSLALQANAAVASLTARVEVRDDALSPPEREQLQRQLAEQLQFTVAGNEADWLREGRDGPPGKLAGVATGQQREARVAAVVPPDRLDSGGGFSAEIEARVEVPKVGVLTRGNHVEISPPLWSIEAETDKTDLAFEGEKQDSITLRARLVPHDTSLLGFYLGGNPQTLSRFLEQETGGQQAGALTVTEEAPEEEWRVWRITPAEQVGEGFEGGPAQLTLRAAVCGSSAIWTVDLNCGGKPRLSCNAAKIEVVAGGEPLEFVAEVLQPGTLEWTIEHEVVTLTEVTVEKKPRHRSLVDLTARPPADVGAGFQAPKQGKLVLNASAMGPQGEIRLPELEVPMSLMDEGIFVIPHPVRLKNDPADPSPGKFEVRVLAYDSYTERVVSDVEAAEGIVFGAWEAAESMAGDNIFTGARVAATPVGTIGTGLQARVEFEIKPGLIIPGSETLIDAGCRLEAPGYSGAKFRREVRFLVPPDPLAVEAARLAQEIANCRKIMRYLPEGPEKQRFDDILNRHAYLMGTKGLVHFRHEIWRTARGYLEKEAAYYLAEAAFYDRAVTVLEWADYVGNLAFGLVMGILVPFPANLFPPMLRAALIDYVQKKLDGKSNQEWADQFLLENGWNFAVDMLAAGVVDLDKLIIQSLPHCPKSWQGVVLAFTIASAVFWIGTFFQTGAKQKPNGDPYAVYEAAVIATQALRDAMIGLLGAQGLKRSQRPDWFPESRWPKPGGTGIEEGIDHARGGDDTSTTALRPGDDDSTTRPPDDDAGSRPTDDEGTGPRDGDEEGAAPRDGDEEGATPRDGDEEGATPRDGDEEGAAPRDGDEEEGGPRDGDEEEGGPRDGDEEEGGPRDGDEEEGGPRDGDEEEGGPRDGDEEEAGPRDGDEEEGGPRDGDEEEGAKRDGDEEGRPTDDEPDPRDPTNELRRKLDEKGELTPEEVADFLRDPQNMRSLKNSKDTELQNAFEKVRAQVLGQAIDAAKRRIAEDILRRELGIPKEELWQRLTQDQDLRERIERIMGDVQYDDFRTPGSEASVNTDTDARFVYQGKEVRTRVYTDAADQAFANSTGYSEARLRQMYADDPQVLRQIDRMSEAERHARWREGHNIEWTDKNHNVSPWDFSDQNPQGEAPVKGAKAGTGDLTDPHGLGLTEAYKSNAELNKGRVSEGLAQTTKGISTLESVRNGLGKHHDVGELPANFQRVAEKLKSLKDETGWDHRFDQSKASELDSFLRDQGFGGQDAALADRIRQFNYQMGEQFQRLRIKRPR